MASNRKFKNGMWKDESEQQERFSSESFLILQSLLGRDFQGMYMRFDQVSGNCSYTFETIRYTYTALVNRSGSIIQENITKK